MRKDRQRRISRIVDVIESERWPVDEWGFARVHSTRLNDITPEYKKDITWLKEHDYLEVDEFCITGVRPYGYRLLEYPFGIPDDVPLDDPFLERLRDDLRRFSLPDDVVIDSDKTCSEKRRADLQAQEKQVRYWRGKKRGTLRISENGRLWSKLTSLRKALRGQLLLDGEETVEVDVKCCQPWFLAVASGDEELLDAVESDEFYGMLQADRGLAKEYFGRVFLTGKDYPPEMRGDRQGPRFFNDTPMSGKRKLVAERFPDAWEWSLQVRLRGIGTAAALQRMEARLIIETVTPELLRRGIPMGTVHDCVVCRRSDAGEVADLVRGKSRELFGRECRLGM